MWSKKTVPLWCKDTVQEKKLWLCSEIIQSYMYQTIIFITIFLMFWINFGIFYRCPKSSKCSWQLIVRHISQNYQLNNFFQVCQRLLFARTDYEGVNECNSLYFMPNSENYYSHLIYSGRATGFYRQAQIFELIRTSL